MKNKDIKKYYFSEKIAIEVGVEEALMLYNIYFWVSGNEEKGTNLKGGKHWTYDTVESFTQKYPYWSTSQIKRIFKNLKNGGYIETGSFNKFGPDKTKWYTVTRKCLDIMKNK